MGTIQLDFQQPLRFELKYVDKDGNDQVPIAIHRVIYGSMERFIGILIEHFAGKFPVWLAPEQIRIVTVNQEEPNTQFAEKIRDQAKELGLRVYLDNDNESVGKKIREAEMQKVPYTLVIGEREIQSGEVIPRVRQDIEVQEENKPISVEEFLKTVVNEAKSRVTHTSMHAYEARK